MPRARSGLPGRIWASSSSSGPKNCGNCPPARPVIHPTAVLGHGPRAHRRALDFSTIRPARPVDTAVMAAEVNTLPSMMERFAGLPPPSLWGEARMQVAGRGWPLRGWARRRPFEESRPASARKRNAAGARPRPDAAGIAPKPGARKFDFHRPASPIRQPALPPTSQRVCRNSYPFERLLVATSDADRKLRMDPPVSEQQMAQRS